MGIIHASVDHRNDNACAGGAGSRDIVGGFSLFPVLVPVLIPALVQTVVVRVAMLGTLSVATV